jgi:hypothetical protein
MFPVRTRNVAWRVWYYPTDEREDSEGAGSALVEADSAEAAIAKWNEEHDGGDVFIAVSAERVS